MTKPRCEDIGFQHLWEDCTPQVALLSYPPQYPPEERHCVNCGKRERAHVHPEQAKWIAYNKGSGKCERLGFGHVWVGVLVASIEHERRCINCGRAEEKEVLREGWVEWREVTPCSDV